jgi:hypothetical protein
MTVYLASPNTQQQAEHAAGMPVLFSFACYSPWLDRYQQTFRRLLIDSGAFSAFTTGKQIDLGAYRAWAARWDGHADAVAGLDDISGDWRQSLRNYEAMPQGFPTVHDTDPPELLKDIVQLAVERKHWIGIGIAPPREGKERFVRWACDNIPEDIHIHGWALRLYTKVRRLDSVDSTNWFRDAFKVRKVYPWLTFGESLEIIVKRYQRENRMIGDESQRMMFSESVEVCDQD